MYRLAGVILALFFLASGTGLLDHLHDLDHARTDAEVMAAAQAEGRPMKGAPVHDDDNCVIHAQLHAPLLAGGWVAFLICLGLYVAFLTLLAPELVPQPAFSRLDCRGPPTLA
jgi:hypothetical protein